MGKRERSPSQSGGSSRPSPKSKTLRDRVADAEITRISKKSRPNDSLQFPVQRPSTCTTNGRTHNSQKPLTVVVPGLPSQSLRHSTTTSTPSKLAKSDSGFYDCTADNPIIVSDEDGGNVENGSRRLGGPSQPPSSSQNWWDQELDRIEREREKKRKSPSQVEGSHTPPPLQPLSHPVDSPAKDQPVQDCLDRDKAQVKVKGGDQDQQQPRQDPENEFITPCPSSKTTTVSLFDCAGSDLSTGITVPSVGPSDSSDTGGISLFAERPLPPGTRNLFPQVSLGEEPRTIHRRDLPLPPSGASLRKDKKSMENLSFSCFTFRKEAPQQIWEKMSTTQAWERLGYGPRANQAEEGQDYEKERVLGEIQIVCCIFAFILDEQRCPGLTQDWFPRFEQIVDKLKGFDNQWKRNQERPFGETMGTQKTQSPSRGWQADVSTPKIKVGSVPVVPFGRFPETAKMLPFAQRYQDFKKRQGRGRP